MMHYSVRKFFQYSRHGNVHTLVTTLKGAQVAALEGALVTDTNSVSVPIAIKGDDVTGISCELVEQCCE